MPDVPLTSVNENCRDNQRSQSFCIDSYKVYDSCGDKDCLSDMQVYFTDDNQTTIDSATSVRIREANVINVSVNVCPITYHNGFYSVDMTFYFEILLDVNGNCSCTNSDAVNGLLVFTKRVILYGGDGRVGVFTSEDTNSCLSPDCLSLPVAKVQVAQPMALNATLTTATTTTLPTNIPTCVSDYFGGDFVTPTTNTVVATIGVFTIVQLERSVQMVIPAYEFCVPKKECVTTTDNPCDVFSKIEFPTEQFFPPNLSEQGNDCSSCCGSCDSKS